jgi:hypothetical protein
MHFEFRLVAAHELNEVRDSLWDLYIPTIRRFFASGTVCTQSRSLPTQIFWSDAPHRLRTVLSTLLAKGLFASLDQQRKISLCEVILDIGVQDHEMVAFSSSLLVWPMQDIAGKASHRSTTYTSPFESGSASIRRRWIES